MICTYVYDRTAGPGGNAVIANHYVTITPVESQLLDTPGRPCERRRGYDRKK